MKFIIRDDDINYHFQAEQLERWYSGIIDICPISVCIPAFVKGDFFKWVNIFENHIPYDKDEWLNDNTVYKIGDNVELCNLIKKWIDSGRVSISLHGVHHRNEEMEIGEVRDNFIRGAEFYTNRNYSQLLLESKSYLSNLFNVDICTFSPPQNMINQTGLRAIKSNNLSLCSDLIRSPRLLRTMYSFYGLLGSFKILFYRFFKGHNYPYIINNGINFVGHYRLQPGIDIEKLKEDFDYVYKMNGIFVLSTHSYGFDFNMSNCDMTMKEALLDILHYSQQFDKIKYITLHDLFKNKMQQ